MASENEHEEEGHVHGPDCDHEHEHEHVPGEEPEQLPQEVQISDVGPCRKHLKVVVDRKAIDKRFDEKYTELVFSDSSPVAGFRPGKAPRKLIERRYQKEVSAQVKNEVLMASLEQLATENKINPLSPPDLDIRQIEIPSEGDLIYEFDIEVAPEFDLPEYKGLKLRRPIHTFSDAEVEKEKRRLLEGDSQLVPKEGDAGVGPDDVITADVTLKYGDEVLNELKETRVKIEKRLVLSDAVAEDFDKQMAGAKVGEDRMVRIRLSQNAAMPLLRGKDIEGRFKILDIKSLRPPEGDELAAVLEETFGLKSPDMFDEVVRMALDRRLEYSQRQSVRQQILEQLAEAQNLELPPDMLRKQAQRALNSRVMEMRNAGLSDEQIESRSRLLRQDVMQSTAAAMKEHFVLQKIAELEKIEIKDDDIDAEIERIAARSDESPRRVRARLEKEDLIETLATEMLERRALDLVLESAEYEEYELTPEDDGDVADLEAQAVPGTAPDESEEIEEETPSEEAK